MHESFHRNERDELLFAQGCMSQRVLGRPGCLYSPSSESFAPELGFVEYVGVQAPLLGDGNRRLVRGLSTFVGESDFLGRGPEYETLAHTVPESVGDVAAIPVEVVGKLFFGCATCAARHGLRVTAPDRSCSARFSPALSPAPSVTFPHRIRTPSELWSKPAPDRRKARKSGPF